MFRSNSFQLYKPELPLFLILKFWVSIQALDYLWFSARGDFASLEDISYCLERFLFVTTVGEREGAFGTQVAGDILQSIEQPITKILGAQNVNSAKVEQCRIKSFPFFQKIIALFSSLNLRCS